MTKETLGAFEELVLLTVQSLAEDAYGANVQRVLEREARRAVSLGAVHTALERLEGKGLLESGASTPVAERGGRSRRVFTVTAAGRSSLRSLHSLRARLANL